MTAGRVRDLIRPVADRRRDGDHWNANQAGHDARQGSFHPSDNDDDPGGVIRRVQERIAVEDGEGLSPMSRAKRRKPARSSHIASLEQQWRITLGTRVDIRQNSRGRGQLVIHFKNNEEYDRLSQLIAESAQEKLQRYAG